MPGEQAAENEGRSLEGHETRPSVAARACTYLRSPEIVVKIPSRLPPKEVTVRTIATAIRDASSPYSMAETADSSLMKRESVFTTDLHMNAFLLRIDMVDCQ